MTKAHKDRKLIAPSLPDAGTSHRAHTRIPEIYEANEEARANAEASRRQLQEDYRRTFSTASGKRVLRNLAILTGQLQSNVVGNVLDRTIDPNGTLHNESMRKVYLHIRQFLKTETLMEAEQNG